MVFQFEQMVLDQLPGQEKWDLAPLSLPRLKESIARWQQGLYRCGWNSLFWNNHDLPRIVSRWGNDGPYRVESAKMLATLLYGLQGTPYLYQGEELGMTNIRLPLSDYVDLETQNLIAQRRAAGYPEAEIEASVYAKSRDNARTPMQWDDTPNAGFTTGTPWLPVNPNYPEVNAAAALADPDSVFHHYRRLIALRKEYPVFREGDFTLLCPESEALFAYTRKTGEEALLVVCNFTDAPQPFSWPAEFAGAVSLVGGPVRETEPLRPYEAHILYQREERP